MIIALHIFFFIYLLIQAIYDIKNQMVLVLYNHFAILISLLGYTYFILKNIISIQNLLINLFVTLVLLLGYYFKMYGSGDIKAMITLLFAYPYLISAYPNSLVPFLICIFISNICMLMIYYPKQWITKTKIKNIAYFPFLLIGFISTDIIFRNYIL